MVTGVILSPGFEILIGLRNIEAGCFLDFWNLSRFWALIESL